MKRFYTFRIVLLALLLIGLSVGTVLFYQHQLYFCLMFALLGIVVVIVLLCYMQHRSVNLILRMVESLRYNDFSLSFSTERKNELESTLRKEINEVVANFRQQLAFHQEQYQYYGTLLDTVDCCLVVIDKDLQVQWMNKSAIHELTGYQIHSLEELDELNEGVSRQIVSLIPGEVKVVRLHKGDLIQEMAVTATVYATATDNLRLINLKNIRSVLEENELEAWQKLVRVLTHEIMNSITPISSLSETLVERMDKVDKDEHDEEMIRKGMLTISRRSKGLLDFVMNYRQLSRIPSPVMTPVRVGDMMDSIRGLFSNDAILFQVEDENRILNIDRSQIEQVIINLLKNAKEACEGKTHPEIIVSTHYSTKQKIFQLEVTDNGYGILPEVQDKVFIPFFTTKRNGSGIGLSLCRQIMSLHGGSISMKSEVDQGTSFVLKFLLS
ncbi:MAG: GHKL domain-containing protein [Bacteroides sp.]|nr:GHKL domain-containing protein [Bacteroides sp.]